jgi:hypothetical protein
VEEHGARACNPDKSPVFSGPFDKPELVRGVQFLPASAHRRGRNLHPIRLTAVICLRIEEGGNPFWQ